MSAGTPTPEFDEDGRDLAGRSLWTAARTLADVGTLMARWLEGDLTYQPVYYGSEPTRRPLH